MTLFLWWAVRIWAMINVIAIAWLMGRGEHGKPDEDGEE